MLYLAFVWKFPEEFRNYNHCSTLFFMKLFFISASIYIACSDNAWFDMKMANSLAWGMLHALCWCRKLKPACFCTSEMKEASLEKAYTNLQNYHPQLWATVENLLTHTFYLEGNNQLYWLFLSVIILHLWICVYTCICRTDTCIAIGCISAFSGVTCSSPPYSAM